MLNNLDFCDEQNNRVRTRVERSFFIRLEARKFVRTEKQMSECQIRQNILRNMRESCKLDIFVYIVQFD